MKTECNCDMPLDIYCDWLRDEGWEIEEEEFNFLLIGSHYACREFKHNGNGQHEINPVYELEQDIIYGIEVYRSCGLIRNLFYDTGYVYENH